MTINTNSYGWLSPPFILKADWLLIALRIIALHIPSVKRKFGDPYRIRTDVNGVRGRCLNHLTNGPWCTFRDSNPGPTD